jgi:hypothetical protein
MAMAAGVFAATAVEGVPQPPPFSVAVWASGLGYEIVVGFADLVPVLESVTDTACD